jgi:hypothetical protein
MTFQIVPNRVAAHQDKRGKVTCVTCKLKKCVGRCHFEVVDCPRTPKAS